VAPVVSPAVKDYCIHAESTGVSAGNACPQCGAATRPDAAWCSLCFAQLAGGFDPLTAPIEEVLGLTEGTTKTLTPPVAHEDIETYAPEVSRHVADPITTDDLASGSLIPIAGPAQSPEVEDDLTEVDVMLAMLAAEHRQTDPTVKVLDRLGDKGSRVLIIISGTAVVGAVVLLSLTILGALT